MEDIFILIFVLGFGVGIFAGLLGIGGGLLIIPALLYLPPLFSQPVLALKSITGIAATQGFASSLSSSWIHYKKGNLNRPMVLMLSGSTIIGAALGGYTSQFYEDIWIQWILLVTLAGIITLFLRSSPPTTEGEQKPFAFENIPINKKRMLMGFVLALGYLAGILGIGGAAFLIPIMYGMLGMSIRMAIGTGAGMSTLR